MDLGTFSELKNYKMNYKLILFCYFMPVDARDGLLDDALAHASERGEFLEEDVRHVAAVVEHQVRLPRVAAAQTSALKERDYS